MLQYFGRFAIHYAAVVILHGALAGPTFILWGENATKPVPSRRKPKQTDPARIALHPYGADTQELRSVLEALPGAPAGLEWQAGQATIDLPATQNIPLPSNPVVAHTPEHEGSPTLAPFKIPALCIPAVEALAFLLHFEGPGMAAPGVMVGHDLAFWKDAVRHAGSLVARQQFLPSLALRDGNYYAYWEPVFSGDDQERMARLARSMPHICRAVFLEEERTTPQPIAARPLLENLVGIVLDHLLRSRDSEAPAPPFHSLHEAWLHALVARDGKVEGTDQELERLADQIETWRRPVSLLDDSPWRLCFRLEEPKKGSEGDEELPWMLTYQVQAREDPSLLVPVAQIWRGRGARALRLMGKGQGAKEYLLSALGQAAALSPMVESSLKDSAPGGRELTTPEAYDFLSNQAPLLEQAGFAIFLPAWWTRKEARPQISARVNVNSPKMQGGGLSLDQVVQFEWNLALGGEELSLRELEELAALKTPLLRLRGQWVQLDASQIRTALDFLTKNANTAGNLRDVVQMMLGSPTATTPIAVDAVRADGWIAAFMDQLQGTKSFQDIPCPAGFSGTLRPYQARGYSWMNFLKQWGLGACLADDMGLGKTPTALAFIQREWENTPPRRRRPVLLVCPTSVITNWQHEASRFTPTLPVLVHHGVKRGKGAAFKKEVGEQAIVISSYALLHRDFEAFRQVGWSGIVLDEAQNIKNPQTKQARAARALEAGWRIALTGTPVENNVGDLWSLMEFLNPGFLGTQIHFRRDFFTPIQAGSDPLAAERLQRLTRPFVLRRLKTDKTIITDLPEKMEMKVFCPLTREQASLYSAVVKDTTRQIEEAEGISRRGLILSTLIMLKQVCNHPAQFLGDNSAIASRSGKMARLTEMLEEILSVGERALVFTQFRQMGIIIQQHLQETFGQEALFLHGGVNKSGRDHMVERFQARSDGPAIFILSLKAGGVGLNLTNANHVFHFDRWWNPAVENQATDRAFRIGQSKNVQVHKFLCAGTLEEKIDAMIEAKQSVAEQITGGGENWLTELSTTELKKLFALRADAVSD